MTSLDFDGATKRFGSVTALDSLDLCVGKGELVSLLGPSGCGKTTALRLVAGFEQPDAGDIRIGGRSMVSVPPNVRDLGMVFQSYSLFPNMTAGENIAFGLRLRKVSSSQRRNRASELLELVGLQGYDGRYAHELSGGQQQRVALARALALEPQALLLDEPLSALDARVRVQLREEIRRLQREVGITTLFVTHDQEEALSVSDRVGVMNAGRLEQIATPEVLYREPATAFVAGFVGTINRLSVVPVENGSVRYGATLVQVPLSTTGSIGMPSGPAVLLVRPESIMVSSTAVGGIGGRIQSRSFRGATTRLGVRTHVGDDVLCDLPSTAADEFRDGVDITLAIRPDTARVVRA